MARRIEASQLAAAMATSLCLAACSGSGTEAGPPADASADATLEADVAADTGPVDTGADVDAADGKPGPPPYDLHANDRKSCKFGPGDPTTVSVGAGIPHGSALPFEHIIVVMQENRSFDHYFSKLPEYGVKDVDVATDDDSNPDPITKTMIKRFHETRYCIVDVNHEWAGVHRQYDDGLMDGFVTTNNPGGARAMGYYDHTDLPYYYWLAKTFAISDRFFCSLLGPTWPNRFFFYGGTAWGRTHTPETPPLGRTKITDLLEKAGKTWKVYKDGITSFPVVFGPSYLGSSIATFEGDVASDKLPNLAIVDPAFSGADQNDEHPPSNMQKGQKFVARIVSAVMKNPAVWKKTVIFFTYDEHGGFYDHVPPPPACEPDSETVPDYKFDRLGIRIPTIVVSAFAKKSFVSHAVVDLTSITRFIENRFDLPAMTKRDANAWPMLDMFDFDAPPFLTPPTGAPSAEPSAAGLDWCAKNPPGTGKP